MKRTGKFRALLIGLSFVLSATLFLPAESQVRSGSSGGGSTPKARSVEYFGGQPYNALKLREDLREAARPSLPNGKRWAQGPEYYYQVSESVWVDVEFLRTRRDELKERITAPVVVLNLAGPDAWISSRLTDLEETDVGPGLTVRSVGATADEVLGALAEIPRASPVVLLAHHPENTDRLSDLSATNPFSYADIKSGMDVPGSLRVVMAC